jgi:hypothetical protein
MARGVGNQKNVEQFSFLNAFGNVLLDRKKRRKCKLDRLKSIH